MPLAPPIPPTSQKADARPISFVLDDQTDAQLSRVSVDLYVRPEEMTISDPSRLAVHHTFGGAFADSWGPGIQTISLSGHTGWIRSADGKDGTERFLKLRDVVFGGWHLRRAAAVSAGRDPSLVHLLLVDTLNRQSTVAAPQSFVLRRSKSRPLLLQYQIQLLVVQRSTGAPPARDFIASPDKRVALPAGIASLLASIEKLASYAKQAQKFIDINLVAPVKLFLEQTEEIYRRVAAAAATVDGVSDSLISVARMSAQAGANLFSSMAAVAGLPARTLGRIMEVAAAFTNVVCVLSNSVKAKSFYTDYSPLYGASNCSSTNGGRPPSSLAAVNPFFALAPAVAASSSATVTQDAQAALRSLANADVVLSPIPMVAIGSLVRSVNVGLALP